MPESNFACMGSQKKGLAMFLRPREVIDSLSKLIGASAISIIMSGCATQAPGSLKPPSSTDFSPGNVSVSFAGHKEDASKFLLEYFYKKSVPVVQTNEGNGIQTITSFIVQVPPQGARRIRQSAYKFKISPKVPASKMACSEMLIAWTSVSKGISESTWSVQPEDDGYIPQSWDDLKAQLGALQCK